MVYVYFRNISACILLYMCYGICAAQSLREVVDDALAYDPLYNSARIAAAAAQFQAAQTHSLRRPGVDVNVSSSRVLNTQPTAFTNERSTSAQLRLTQSIFNRANDLSIAQADNNAISSYSTELARYQDLIVRVGQAYFNVLASREAVEFSRSNAEGLTEQLNVTKQSVAYGVAAGADISDAQARLDLAQADLNAAQNDFQGKILALEIVSHRSSRTPHRLASKELPVLKLEDIEGYIETSDDVPSIKIARIALENATLEADRARASRLPTLDFNAGLTKGTDRVRGQEYESSEGTVFPYSLPISISGASRQFSVGLVFKIPIFSGFSSLNRMDQTILLKEQAVLDLENARQTLRAATLQAFFDFNTNLSQARALLVAEKSSRISLEAAKEGYRLGIRANVDVLNAQTQVFNTLRQLAQARYSTLIGYLKTLQACGRLDSAVLYKLDALLEMQ